MTKTQGLKMSKKPKAEMTVAAKIEALGADVAARVEKMRKYESSAIEKAGHDLKKADELRVSIHAQLKKAKALCREADAPMTFKEFQAKYAPNIGRTQLYQILAIADGRTNGGVGRAPTPSPRPIRRRRGPAQRPSHAAPV
jgi:hypothetical protein